MCAPPFEIATILAATRQPEKALDWLDGAIYERSQPINFLQLNPTFAGLRRSRPPGVVPPVASTDGINFDRQPLPEERAALLAYLRKL